MTTSWTRGAQRLRAFAAAPLVVDFLKGVAWSAGATAFERLVALFQAFYIARVLGIELFGKYGLLFTTVGLISSIAGLQLGLTAAVHISRHGHSEPARAAAVMRLCEIVSLGLVLVCIFAIAVSPTLAARMLLGSAEHSDVILAGASIAFLAVIGGVQEGVLQGLEEFRRLSLARLTCSIAGLAILFAMAQSGDLLSVITAIAIGSAIRAVWLLGLKEIAARRLGLTTSFINLWQVRRVIFDFSVPSVLVSLIGGTATWYGMWLLASAPQGFKEIAILTAGQQWRGVVLYLASISASVAIPTMSRLSGSGNFAALSRIHRLNLWANILIAAVIVLGVGIASKAILSNYGSEFTSGSVAFWTIIATTLPTVYANVLLQLLVSQGRMWEQLGYYVLQSIPLAIGYYLIVPLQGAIGYALWTAIISVSICAVLAVRVRANGAPRSDAYEKKT